MKFKHLFLCGATMLASTLFFSCQQENEPSNSKELNEGETVEWTVDVALAGDFRTRAAAEGSVGADGLYTFSREIDRLWYAVYYNGEYLYDSEQPESPNAVKTSDGHFKVPFKFLNTTDFTNVYIFFWAGNAEDNVTIDDVQTISDGINLNFRKRCVSVDPKYLNGNNTELKEYDSFAGYVQLSATNAVTDYGVVTTLHRPFAQIHVLTDEFTQPAVYADYPNGVTVVPGFGSAAATTSNYTTNLVSPTTWYYDSSIGLNPGYGQNEYQYSLTNYEFTNELSRVSPERVTFKEREMDYMGCYYVFAPVEKSPLKIKESTGLTSVLGKVNLAFCKKGESITSSQFASVDLPAEGIKANNKYVIYNRDVNGDKDGDGEFEPGPGGFLTSNFVFEVISDPEWEDPNEIEK